MVTHFITKTWHKVYANSCLKL